MVTHWSGSSRWGRTSQEAKTFIPTEVQMLLNHLRVMQLSL